MYFYVFKQPKPRIDYTLKAVGGSLTAIPGLSDMIDVSWVIIPWLCTCTTLLNYFYYFMDLLCVFVMGRILYIQLSQTCSSGRIGLLFQLVVYLWIQGNYLYFFCCCYLPEQQILGTFPKYLLLSDQPRPKVSKWPNYLLGPILLKMLQSN